MSKQIKISEVLNDLENGVTRVQMTEKYDISAREVKALFEHPKLKGKKAKKGVALTFVIVDDAEEGVTAKAEVETAEASLVDDVVDATNNSDTSFE